MVFSLNLQWVIRFPTQIPFLNAKKRKIVIYDFGPLEDNEDLHFVFKYTQNYSSSNSAFSIFE